jgi:hypothetical protein
MLEIDVNYNITFHWKALKNIPELEFWVFNIHHLETLYICVHAHVPTWACTSTFSKIFLRYSKMLSMSGSALIWLRAGICSVISILVP